MMAELYLELQETASSNGFYMLAFRFRGL